MLDKSAEGLSFAPFEMPIERGKVREFAQAVMSSDRGYFDDPQTVTPPTFLVATAWWAPPESTAVGGPLKINVARTLHGGQEFVFHGPPPRAGTNLAAQTRIDKVYEKEGRRGGTMKFIEIVIDFKDEQGNLVAEARSTVIETSQAPTAPDAKEQT